MKRSTSQIYSVLRFGRSHISWRFQNSKTQYGTVERQSSAELEKKETERKKEKEIEKGGERDGERERRRWR